MQVAPRNSKEWLRVLPLLVKLYVLLAYPILSAYYDILVQTGNSHAWVHREMQGIAGPFQTVYFLAFILLLGFGLIEQLEERRRQAIWDYLFAVIALGCWFQLSGMTQTLK